MRTSNRENHSYTINDRIIENLQDKRLNWWSFLKDELHRIR